MFAKLKSWFQDHFAFFTGEEASNMRVQNVGGTAEQLIQETAMGSPSQAQHMGWLKEAGVQPEDFAKLCSGFAKGVNYIARRYGTEPSAIVINDRKPERKFGLHYNYETKKIFLTRKGAFQIVAGKS